MASAVEELPHVKVFLDLKDVPAGLDLRELVYVKYECVLQIIQLRSGAKVTLSGKASGNTNPETLSQPTHLRIEHSDIDQLLKAGEMAAELAQSISLEVDRFRSLALKQDRDKDSTCSQHIRSKSPPKPRKTSPSRVPPQPSLSASASSSKRRRFETPKSEKVFFHPIDVPAGLSLRALVCEKYKDALKNIEARSGVHVTLCGQGSGTSESPEPIHLKIEHPDFFVLVRGTKMAKELVQSIRLECDTYHSLQLQQQNHQDVVSPLQNQINAYHETGSVSSISQPLYSPGESYPEEEEDCFPSPKSGGSVAQNGLPAASKRLKLNDQIQQATWDTLKGNKCGQSKTSLSQLSGENIQPWRPEPSRHQAQLSNTIDGKNHLASLPSGLEADGSRAREAVSFQLQAAQNTSTTPFWHAAQSTATLPSWNSSELTSTLQSWKSAESNDMLQSWKSVESAATLPSWKSAETTATLPSWKSAESTATLPSWKSAETTATLPSWKSAESTATLPSWKSAETTATLPSWKSAESTATLPSWKSAETTATLPSWKSAEATATLPPRKTAESTATLPPWKIAESTATLPPWKIAESTATLPSWKSAESTSTLPPSKTAESTANLPPWRSAESTAPLPPWKSAESTAPLPPWKTAESTVALPPWKNAESTNSVPPWKTVESTDTIPPWKTAKSTSTLLPWKTAESIDTLPPWHTAESTATLPPWKTTEPTATLTSWQPTQSTDNLPFWHPGQPTSVQQQKQYALSNTNTPKFNQVSLAGTSTGAIGHFVLESNFGPVTVQQCADKAGSLYAAIANQLFGPFRSFHEQTLSGSTLRQQAVHYLRKQKESFYNDVKTFYEQTHPIHCIDPEMLFESGCFDLLKSIDELSWKGHTILLEAVAVIFSTAITIYEEVKTVGNVVTMQLLFKLGSSKEKPISVLRRKSSKNHYDSLILNKWPRTVEESHNVVSSSGLTRSSSDNYLPTTSKNDTSMAMANNDLPTNSITQKAKPTPKKNKNKNKFRVTTWNLQNLLELNRMEVIDNVFHTEISSFVCMQCQVSHGFPVLKKTSNYNWQFGGKTTDDNCLVFLVDKSNFRLTKFVDHAPGIISAEVMCFKPKKRFHAIGCLCPENEPSSYFKQLSRIIVSFPSDVELVVLGEFRGQVEFSELHKMAPHLIGPSYVEAKHRRDKVGALLMDLALKHRLSFISTWHTASDTPATLKISKYSLYQTGHILLRESRRFECNGNYRKWYKVHSQHAIVTCSIKPKL